MSGASPRRITSTALVDLGMAAALGLTSAVAAPRPMSAPPPAELPKILNRGTMRDPPLPLLLPPRMATADLALRTTRDVLVAFSDFGGGGSGLCKRIAVKGEYIRFITRSIYNKGHRVII